MSATRREIIQIFTDRKCLICWQDPDDIHLGRFFKLPDFSVHYLCVLTASNLYQRGRANDGFFGFKLCDIKAAYYSYLKKFCVYCKKSGASIVCKYCKGPSHLPCALKNGVTIQMRGAYLAYCSGCIEVETPAIMEDGTDHKCAICRMDITKEEKPYWPQCCTPNEVIHMECLRIYAFNAGSLTKCPLCSSKAKFRNSIMLRGIFIPQQDATWFSDNQVEQVQLLSCSAFNCLMLTKQISEEPLFCIICFANAAHTECSFFKIFLCTDCTIDLWPDLKREGELPLKKRKLTVREGYSCPPWLNLLRAMSLKMSPNDVQIKRMWEYIYYLLDGENSPSTSTDRPPTELPQKYKRYIIDTLFALNKAQLKKEDEDKLDVTVTSTDNVNKEDMIFGRPGHFIPDTDELDVSGTSTEIVDVENFEDDKDELDVTLRSTEHLDGENMTNLSLGHLFHDTDELDVTEHLDNENLTSPSLAHFIHDTDDLDAILELTEHLDSEYMINQSLGDFIPDTDELDMILELTEHVNSEDMTNQSLGDFIPDADELDVPLGLDNEDTGIPSSLWATYPYYLPDVPTEDAADKIVVQDENQDPNTNE